MALLEFTDKGIYCRAADCYIDPWKPVKTALITHAHSDHARSGHKKYMATSDSVPILKHRLGLFITIQGVGYGEVIHVNGVKISFHPAGHIIGSAQIRLEHKGEIWVVSGDYKLEDDGICTPFEPIKCHTFITECTFGLPSFRWLDQKIIFEQINQWWRDNQQKGVTSIISAYSLGKAQRIVTHLDQSIGEIFTHGAIENTHDVLRKQGFDLRKGNKIVDNTNIKTYEGAMIIAPPSAIGSAWTQRFGKYEEASVSGWMAVRGLRRRRNMDRGFVLSDHADWDGLMCAIRETGAENIFVTHGYTQIFARWLHEQGYNAGVVQTEFDGDETTDQEIVNPNDA
ncbi:MAG: ligase-associated DNA damage response exonuclease [Saprospiraceae bacterium]